MFHQRVAPASAAIPSPGRIEGIEALRGIAATAVVLCHAARHVDEAFGAPALLRLFQPGHSGVDLFFVLSGFIILLVHRRDVGRPERLARYAWRRFVRVWPLYWLALGATLAISVAGGHALPGVGTLGWNLTLLPTAGEPILGIAWTLQYEALFYLLFGVLLIERRLGIIALAGWLALVMLGLASGWQAGVATGIFAIEFFMGMAAATIVRRDLVPRPRWLAVGGGLLFALAWSAEAGGVLDGYGVLARLAYGLPSAMVVAGVAAWKPGVPRLIAGLGASSYATYLFHLLGIGVAWQVLGRLGVVMPAGAWFVVLAGSGIAAGLVVHRVAERPILARLRR